MKQLDVKLLVPHERYPNFENLVARSSGEAAKLVTKPEPRHTQFQTAYRERVSRARPGRRFRGLARENRQGYRGEAVRTAPLPVPLSLEASAACPSRRVLVQQPGLKVMRLTLAPGQRLPSYRQSGLYVFLQAFRGNVTVRHEGEKIRLFSQQLLGFSGDHIISLRNDSDAPSTLLVTLIEIDERGENGEPSFTASPRVP